MRLGLKSVFVLVAGYAVLVAGFGLAIDRWLRDFEDQGAMQTVRLIASENAAQISERALGALGDPDETSRRLLRSRLEDIVLFSEVVSSLTVVDEGGRVVASDLWPSGELLPEPRVVFGDDIAVRVRGERVGLLDGGSFRVDVPVLEGRRLVGYVEVGLFNEEISHLYSRARRQLLLGALLGLVGVVVLGVALQLQINRRAATISRTLEDAIGPGADAEGEPRMDELTRALEAAGRARQAILDAREDQARVGDGFKALAQVSKVGVLKLGGHREVAFANRRALELLGYSTLDELREAWRTVGPVLTPLDSQPALVEFPGQGRSRRLRVETYCLGGAERGETLALLVDPDVLETLETDVRLASRLEGLARAYRTLAHEVRAPLSAMMINLDLLRESLVGAVSPAGGAKGEPERHAAVLRQELLRLNRTLSEVLTRTLPDRKAQRLDLADALRELETLLAAQARRQGVELVMSLPGPPVFLVGLRDRLKQAFLNVAVNALEALPSGGRIEVRMTPGPDRVVVSFCDDGPGIPRAVLAHIYERDFTTKGDGSGIGLYVARSLVELHGGTIRVDSEAGRGTTVVVELPVVPQR